VRFKRFSRSDGDSRGEYFNLREDGVPGYRAIVEYGGLREAVFVDGSEIIFWVVAAAVGIVGGVFTAYFF
jgi:hypothetical protein